MASALAKAITSFSPAQCADEAEKLELISAAQALIARLRTPTELLVNVAAETPVVNGVLRILLDKKVFQLWKAHGSDEPRTAQHLASLAGMDPVLLSRLLRVMVSQNFLDQVDEDTFKFNSATTGLTEPAADSWSSFSYGVIEPLIQHMPIHFREHGYRNPTDPQRCIYPAAIGQPDKSFFQILSSDPELRGHFNVAVESWSKFRTHWLDFFPSQSLIDDTERPIIVDVGGGIGQDINKFNHKHPGYAARLVLAELPAVAKQAICDSSVEVIEHDFFTPMPIEGACAYYLSKVLHNWPDDKVIEILCQIRPAMAPGYSKILINDQVMARLKPRPFNTMLDIMMMGLLGALERTETQWRQVIEAAGLKLVKVWSDPSALESVLEVELPSGMS